MATKKPLPAYEQPTDDPVPDWSAGDAYLDSIKPAPPPPPQAGVLRTIGDMGIKTAQGVVDYGQSVMGRASLLTGGKAGEWARDAGYDPEATNQFLGNYLSDSQKQSEQNVDEAHGFVDKTIANIKNPRALAGSIFESLPALGETMAIPGLAAERIGIKAAMSTAEGLAASEAAIAAGKTTTEAAQAALEADAAAANSATQAARAINPTAAPIKSAAQTALDANAKQFMAMGAASEGSESAGQIADQAQGQGRDYSDYVLPSVAAGLGTAGISFAAGNLLGSAKTQIATGSNLTGVTGGKVAQIGKEFLHEGVLQGLPRSAQEQYFTNIANGEPDVMKGVVDAGASGMMAGGAMGVGFGALGHGHGKNDEAHGDPNQATTTPLVLADTGVLSQAANAGQAALAAKTNAQQDLSKPLEYTPTPIPDQSAQPLSLFDDSAPANQPHPNSIDYTTPEATQNTAGLENLQTYSSMGNGYSLDYLQEAIPRLNASGQSKPLTIIPHAEGGYTVAPTSALTQSILTAVQHLQAPAQVGSSDAALPPISHQALQSMAITRAMSAPTGFGEHAQMEGLLKEDRDRAATAQANQSRIDAQQAKQQQDDAIKAVDARTAAAYQRQADANRAALRNNVLDNDSIPPERKKDAYAAALKRDGYINPRLTDEDHAHIDDAIAPIPSTPNELINAVPEKVARQRARAAGVNTDSVDNAIAQGMVLKTPSGNILHKPGSTKIFKLNDGQKSYYQQAIKRVNQDVQAPRPLDIKAATGTVDAGRHAETGFAPDDVATHTDTTATKGQELSDGGVGAVQANEQEHAPITELKPVVPPGLEKARRLKAERDAEKQRAAEAALKEPETEKFAEDIAFDNEMSDALSHLGDVLGDVFGAKLNITGQQHTAGALLPALSKVIELLMRKGARSLQQAVSQASKLMRANPAIAPHVDKISPRQWKAAYNAIAEFHTGTDSEFDVANTHPDDVAAYATPEKVATPVAEPAAPVKNVSTAPEHAQNTGTPLDRSVKYDKTANQANKLGQGEIDEGIVPLTMNKDDFKEVTDEWANLFADPDKRTITGQRVKDTPIITVDAAKNVIDGWKEHARQQGEQNRSENSQKTVLSLFDLSGEWSKPWKEAGYNVITMDIQTGQDIHDLSVEYFTEHYDISDVYAILAATPCTDFAASGSRHFAAKDADGRTEASKQLVFQTMRTIEYFRPAIWTLENPVGRIEDLTGLPKARMTFDPNHFGEPYTKKTMLWGNFNSELPTAHVEPTEGSKMWSQYGGKSQATKNARSVTPEGFAYAFFMANNYIDMPAEQKLTAQYPEASGAIKQALKAGVSEKRIHDLIEHDYGNEDFADARNSLIQEVADIKSGKTVGDAASRQDETPKLSTQELNRLSVKQMTDEQLLQAKDELPKRAGPIAKEIKLRDLNKPEVDQDGSREIQDSIDGKRDDTSTTEEIQAGQERDGEQGVAPISPAIPEIPVRPLSAMHVVVDTVNADAGKSTRESVAANDALRDVSHRIQSLEDFLTCMTG